MHFFVISGTTGEGRIFYTQRKYDYQTIAGSLPDGRIDAVFPSQELADDALRNHEYQFNMIRNIVYLDMTSTRSDGLIIQDEIQVNELAMEWLDCGFHSTQVQDWLASGTYTAEAARDLNRQGLSPEDCKRVPYGCEVSIGGAVARGDITARDAWVLGLHMAPKRIQRFHDSVMAGQWS